MIPDHSVTFHSSLFLVYSLLFLVYAQPRRVVYKVHRLDLVHHLDLFVVLLNQVRN